MINLTSLNKEEAIRYLGYGNNSPDEKISKLIDECEKELLGVVSPKYLYKGFDLKFCDNYIEVLGTKLKLEGNDITNHLEGCERVVLMCATISHGVDKLIRTLQISDMAKAVIADALASASIEQVCNLVEEKIRNDYSDYYMTWRFSPGYGDLSINTQKVFLDVLNANKLIGLCASENAILTPKKSVTAIIGLSKEQIKKEKMGCQSCNLKDTCQFRKRGDRCIGY